MTFKEPIFVDTWGWLALSHRRDNFHQLVKELYLKLRQENTPIYTSYYVLDELISLLFKREDFQYSMKFIEGIFLANEQDILRIEQVTSSRFNSALVLRKKIQDKPNISFTDFTSMIIMQETNIQHILTQDKHFLQVEWDLSHYFSCSKRLISTNMPFNNYKSISQVLQDFPLIHEEKAILKPLPIVKAKKDNFEEGWGQCLAELLTAQKLNSQQDARIFGIVSNGKLWEFAQLKDNVFTKNSPPYLLDELKLLMGIVNFVFDPIIVVTIHFCKMLQKKGFWHEVRAI